MLRRLILQIVAGILGLWLAVRLLLEVKFTGPLFLIPGRGIGFNEIWGTLVFVGAVWGFLNLFVKPILKKITLPLRIITFNLFSLIIAMGLVWVVDVFSEELIIQGLYPLFWTTIILWGISFLLSSFAPKKSL